MTSDITEETPPPQHLNKLSSGIAKLWTESTVFEDMLVC